MEHLVYSAETEFGSWVTPTRAIAVDDANWDSERAVDEQPTTGSGRAPYLHVLGAKPVTGGFTTRWWVANIATLFGQFMRDFQTTTPAGATDARDHGFLYDDEQNPLGLSVQKIYTSTLARNILSAIPNQVTLSFAAKEAAKLIFDAPAKDIVRAEQLWDSLGTASDAVIASPTYPAVRRPLYFYDAQITIGGTPSLDLATNKIAIADGDVVTKVHNIQVVINHNLDTDAFSLMRDPTILELVWGARNIQITLDVSWSDYATDLYDAAHAGEAMALDIDLRHSDEIEAGFNYEGHVVVPSLFFDPMKLPNIGGDKARKTVSLTARAQQDPITARDINVWIRSAEASL
ncbi:MAG TPA: hypothetical protein VJG32_18005 [Anaerolineae bacterium]|nr:hypothetical protein [Anaerolineae bacterium]